MIVSSASTLEDNQFPCGHRQPVAWSQASSFVILTNSLVSRKLWVCTFGAPCLRKLPSDRLFSLVALPFAVAGRVRSVQATILALVCRKEAVGLCAVVISRLACAFKALLSLFRLGCPPEKCI